MTLAVHPFTIDVAQEVLDDLRTRIGQTRWPDPAPGERWSQGTDLEYLRALAGYWAHGFDWRARERDLNGFAQFRAEVDGTTVHFVHERARSGHGVPLVLSHGWPSAFTEYLELMPYLTDPAGHGINGPAFDVVIPSLPGYGFSPRPARTGVTYRYTASLWHRLMRGLGYQRYGAHGADFGAGVTTYMALDDPGALLGIHLSTPELIPYLGPGSRPLTEAEREFVEHSRRWAETERGYSLIQSTKPQTVGYGLTDSPAGLAGWILEKWRSWSDSGGDLDSRFSRDFLLTLVTIYWVTGSIASSMRDYYDNRWHRDPLGPTDRVTVPTAMAVFANHFVPEGEPPREWIERLYDLRRWTPMPRGGHFAAIEEPQLLARDIAAFFADT
ncbi:MAG TPA: epoxide hydrolase [Solirubrobacterales bacterium]|nr:epoxide hydrolase [Solirubrobacterales bacterium]